MADLLVVAALVEFGGLLAVAEPPLHRVALARLWCVAPGMGNIEIRCFGVSRISDREASLPRHDISFRRLDKSGRSPVPVISNLPALPLYAEVICQSAQERSDIWSKLLRHRGSLCLKSYCCKPFTFFKREGHEATGHKSEILTASHAALVSESSGCYPFCGCVQESGRVCYLMGLSARVVSR